MAKWGGAVKTVMEAKWPSDPRVAMLPAGLVEQWHADGFDLDLDVLPTVRQLCADKRGDPISTLKYFTEAIKRRHTERTAAAETPSPSQFLSTREKVSRHRVALDAGAEPPWCRLVDGAPPDDPACSLSPDLLREFGFHEAADAQARRFRPLTDEEKRERSAQLAAIKAKRAA